MPKTDLSALRGAIADHKKIIQEYERSNEVNSLLLGRLRDLEKELLDEHFSATTDKPVKSPRKRDKPLAPAPINKMDT